MLQRQARGDGGWEALLTLLGEAQGTEQLHWPSGEEELRMCVCECVCDEVSN